MKPLTLTIPGRPRSTKNSRQIVRAGGRMRSVMSESAAAWIKGARAHLRRAWKGRPLAHAVHIHFHVVFANRRSLPDPDNLTNAGLDALKGIVLRDDCLRCVPSFSFSHEVTPGAAECLVVTLTEVPG